MAEIVLDIKNVSVHFGGVRAIDDASLTIEDRDFIGFVGPNGAGKTTLMRVIMGIITPQQGTVHLSGQNLKPFRTEERIRKGMALAQQIVQPLRELSLLENVAFACGQAKTRHPLQALRNFGFSSENKKATQLLEMVGLGEHIHKMPNTLPLGYLKRLEMARTLALDPKILFLDEPLAGLNQSEANAIADLISDINKTGVTILLIEHNLGEVVRVCPKVYVQDQGKSLAFGKTKEVMTRPDVLKAYLGS